MPSRSVTPLKSPTIERKGSHSPMGDLAPVMNMFEQPPKVKPFKIKMPSINRHSINPDSERKLAIRTHDQSPSNDQGKSTIEKNEEL